MLPGELWPLAHRYLLPAALVSVRVAVIFASFPPPFSSVAPGRMRALLSLLVAWLLCLSLPALPTVTVEPMPALLKAVLGEVLAGGVIGLTVRATLAAAEIAGDIAAFSMGLAFAASVDPLHGGQSTPVAQVMNALAALIFFALEAHHAVLQALVASLHTAPPGGAFVILTRTNVLHIGGEMLAHGLRFASPVVATMFIVQLSTGLVARAAPRVNLFSLAFGIAATVGMLTLLVSAPSIVHAITAVVRTLGPELARVVGR
ncbi:MAG: flagellar biosynthetic protein FliR [Polyangiales bacterium]